MFYGCWSPVWLSARHFSNSPALTPMHSYVVLGFSQYPASCFSISAVNHCVFLKSCRYTKYRHLLENKHSLSFPLRFQEFKAYFIYTHICKCFYLLEQSLNLTMQVYVIYLLTNLLHFEDQYNALPTFEKCNYGQFICWAVYKYRFSQCLPVKQIFNHLSIFAMQQ